MTMSRTQSPLVAAKKGERLRRERRKERLMLAVVVLVMLASMIAYGFYLKYFYFNKPGSRKKPPASHAAPK